MNKDDRFSNASGEPDWDAIARALLDRGAPAEREALLRYLAEHPDRAALLDALDRATAREAKREHASVDVEAGVAAVFARRRREAGPASARIAARWPRAALRAAAAVVVTLGAGLLWRSATRDEAPAARYAAAAGASREVRLPDGTRVLLAPMSSLDVASGYGDARRSVALQGEAYFEVPHDESRPFVVRTADAVVHDLGTAFTVRARASRPTQVVVTSGAVTLSAAGEPPDTLRAGDRGRMERDAVVVERGAATAHDLAWTRGELAFRGVPVGEVAAELTRWYGVEVVVADSTLARRRISVTLRVGENVDDVLRVVAGTVGAEAHRRGDTAILLPARAR
jgi:transmembrane sensor